MNKEEIEKLKKDYDYYFQKNCELNNLNTSLRSDRDIYKHRIDKAIQILEKHSIDCFEKWYDNNDFSEIMQIIIKILKGE